MALYSRKSSGTNTLRYLLHDHLGSVDAITTSSGAVELRESFEAFGSRRGSAWSGVPSSAQLATMRGVTRRGYTGHEHLDSTALIHLNGRVYDPALGRFISADPVIDGALNTQGWNAYAYVKNSPLSFTDPTGLSRSPPTTRVLPIDPHSGLESITVEASRLYDSPIGPMFGFGSGGLQGSDGRSREMEEIVVTGRRSRPPEPTEPPDPPIRPQQPLANQADAHPGDEHCSSQSRSVMRTTVSDAHSNTGDPLVERAITGGQIGGLVGGVTGSLGGAVYGLRVGMQEARHLSLIYRVLAVSEGAAAGAFAGGATLFPYGAVIGAALFTGVELIVSADRTTTTEPLPVLDGDGC